VFLPIYPMNRLIENLQLFWTSLVRSSSSAN